MKSEYPHTQIIWKEFLKLKPEIAAMLETIKGKITRPIIKKNHDLKAMLRKTTAALNEINEDAKDSGLLKSHIFPMIAFLETAGKILGLSGISDLIGKISLSFSHSADASQADVQTALLKLAPEILEITHKFQSVLDLKTSSKKFHKSGKKSAFDLELEFENLYVMSIVAEQACEEWKQTPLDFRLLSEHSSSIINFFLHTLSNLYVEHPRSEFLFKLEIRLFNLIDKIYVLLDKPITLYPSQLRSKYYQALYFFSQEEIDTQAAILALNKVLLFNSQNTAHQLEKIYVLEILSLSSRNIINLRKIPHPEQFSEIFLHFSEEMMTMYLLSSAPDSKTYTGIVKSVLEVAIFCQKDRQNVENIISRLQMLIAANKLTALSEQEYLPPLQLIVKFITASNLSDNTWLSILLISVGEQFISKISTPQIVGYRSIFADFIQKLTFYQTKNYVREDFKKNSPGNQIDFDKEKFSELKPRIIKNITESQKKLHKIYKKNKNPDEKSLSGLSPILESLTKLCETISKCPEGLDRPEMLRQIPVFFLQVISYLDSLPEYDEFQFKSNLFDSIDEILLLFSQDSKAQFFQFQCFFLKIRELLSRTNPDIEKLTELAGKLTAESCDPGRLHDHQLLIFGACESHLQKFNYLKTPQTQDKFIPIITFLAQKIIHIHEKNPDRIVETVNQILAIASFFLCMKDFRSIKSQLIYRGAEEIISNLHRIVLSYEKSKAALPKTDECLSILTRLNKIIIAAESLKNLDIKLLNWLLQTGNVFFLREFHNHAGISRFQDLLNKKQETQTQEHTFKDEKNSEFPTQEERICEVSLKNNEIKQQKEKVPEIPLINTEIPVQKEKKLVEVSAPGNSPLTLAKEDPLVKTLQKEIKQKKADLLTLTNRNDSLKKEVRALNRSLTKNSKKYDTAANQIEDLTKKFQASEQNVLQLQQDLAKTENQLLAQKTEYVTQVQHHEQIIAALKIEIKKEQDDHTDLHSICNSLSLEKAVLHRNVETLTVELEKQKQDNLQLLHVHNQTLLSHDAERALIIQKHEAEQKADARARTKQFLSLHQEIARLKIKAGEVYEQSPPQTPWRPHFPFSSGATTHVVSSPSPPDSESSGSEDQVFGYLGSYSYP